MARLTWNCTAQRREEERELQVKYPMDARLKLAGGGMVKLRMTTSPP